MFLIIFKKQEVGIYGPGGNAGMMKETQDREGCEWVWRLTAACDRSTQEDPYKFEVQATE